MPENFQILQADITHLEVLTPLFDGYRQFYKQASDLTGARQFLQERLQQNQSTILLAQAQQALGFTQLYPSFTSVGMRPIWILNDLFVAEAGRKKGVGKALLDEAASFAKNSGASQLVLETGVDNRTAQRLYEKNGWAQNKGAYYYSLQL